MSYFDSHCHLTDDRFDGEAAAVADRARAAGVDGFVLIGSDAPDSDRAHTLARDLKVWSTAGIHPHQAAAASRFDHVRDLVLEEGVVAVGETGLDYYYDNAPRAEQRALFDRHLGLAAEVGKPVVVHSREADDDTIAAIRAAPAALTGVLHCFAGGPRLFDAAVEAGWYVSFSGLVTFGSYATKDLVAATPADRLLIETDSPYLAPVPHRGRRNEPAFVVDVARAVAELRSQSVEEVGRTTTRNARRFYGLEAAEGGDGAGG